MDKYVIPSRSLTASPLKPPNRGETRNVAMPFEPYSESADQGMRDLVLRRTTQTTARVRRKELSPDSPQQMPEVDLSQCRICTHQLAKMPPEFWLRHSALPWMQIGDLCVIALGDPALRSTVQSALQHCGADLSFVAAPRVQIIAHLEQHLHRSMAAQASLGPPEPLSCRFLKRGLPVQSLWLGIGALLAACLAFPQAVFLTLTLCALLLLFCFTLFRLSGLLGYATRPKQQPPAPPLRRLPHAVRISMLVPLYKEADISHALLRRLNRLTYPKDRLEVLLVVETGDHMTQQAISATPLPDWIRMIEVPRHGDLRTKPRAMNYALNFCRGDIIGVWDAEDAPEPDQLERVVESFANAPKNTACFQGVLDYYNTRSSWIARCFTLEYGVWFRILMPGIARLGLVLPLGGTTMFLRRDVLDRIGGWDAHNVTEDADLGVRLFRMGYRTEMLPSVTYEEAAHNVWPWIRQRSRWLKGFMMTYLVHMRAPRRLLSELGLRGFLGVQAFFLGTLGQFLLAPFLWSFWLFTLGAAHPAESLVPMPWLTGAVVLVVFFELLNQGAAIFAAFAMRRPYLAIWAPCLLFYYPLAVIAAYKAAWELFTRPFFWDKTDHGSSATTDQTSELMADTPPDPRTSEPSSERGLRHPV